MLFAAVLALAAPASAEWKEKVLYNFQGGKDGFDPIGGIVFDKQGNLYGTTQAGGPPSCAPNRQSSASQYPRNRRTHSTMKSAPALLKSRDGARSGAFRDLPDWASLPALLFVITALAFLATPAFNAVSRHFEHEADRYGLEVIHGIVPNSNQVAAHYFEKSGEMNLSDPEPSTGREPVVERPLDVFCNCRTLDSYARRK